MTAYSTIQKKCKTHEDIRSMAQDWHTSNKTIVFTNGCFDLLHLGHIDYLSKAADLGDILVVGLNSDESVTRLKGNHRPLQNEASRTMLMAALEFVDAVVVFAEDTPIELIKTIRPDILVKGGDYTQETVVGADLVKDKGGKVMLIPFLDGHSTSAIEHKIIGRKH
jgi:D-glycero-beta-D-manno-heptose 1-phosphate adenylyltransferase